MLLKVGTANISKENVYHKVEFVLLFLSPFRMLWEDMAAISFKLLTEIHAFKLQTVSSFQL